MFDLSNILKITVHLVTSGIYLMILKNTEALGFHKKLLQKVRMRVIENLCNVRNFIQTDSYS